MGPSGYRAFVLSLSGPRFGDSNKATALGNDPNPFILALRIHVSGTSMYAVFIVVLLKIIKPLNLNWDNPKSN